MSTKLGQHFLVNRSIRRQIVEALDLETCDTVIEIGAGHGELTREMVYKFRSLKVEKFRIVAIEKDLRLAQDLRLRIKDLSVQTALDGQTEVVQGDALRLLPQIINFQLSTSNFKLVGNIPFYITGRLLRVLSELTHKPKLAVLTIQKEVATRLSARPPKTNLLAASVQFWAKPEILEYIPKDAFRPKPKVDAAVIRLKTKDLSAMEKAGSKNTYYKLLRALFKQPRKTILNNLMAARAAQSKEKLIKKLECVGVAPYDRPHDLDIETIIKLSEVLYNE